MYASRPASGRGATDGGQSARDRPTPAGAVARARIPGTEEHLEEFVSPNDPNRVGRRFWALLNQRAIRAGGTGRHILRKILDTRRAVSHSHSAREL